MFTYFYIDSFWCLIIPEDLCISAQNTMPSPSVMLMSSNCMKRTSIPWIGDKYTKFVRYFCRNITFKFRNNMKTREFKLRKGIPGCIMILFLVVLVYTGCGKNDREEPLIPTLSVNIDISSPFTFTSAGGTSEAKTVTTNQSSWNVVSNQSWCTVLQRMILT